jgi:hypothetical protein
MILSLDEIKQRLIQEKDLHTSGSSSADIKKNVQDTMTILAELMMKYPEQIEEIEESIKDGEEFRCYFEDEDTLRELGEMRYSDPERFYRIIRKEELFLNTCLQAFGFHNYLVSLNPDKLFGQL